MQLATDTVAADKLEPLLAPNPQRFVLFPIKHHQVWEMYKKHEVRPLAPRPLPRPVPLPRCRCRPTPCPLPPRVVLLGPRRAAQRTRRRAQRRSCCAGAGGGGRPKGRARALAVRMHGSPAGAGAPPGVLLDCARSPHLPARTPGPSQCSQM